MEPDSFDRITPVPVDLGAGAAAPSGDAHRAGATLRRLYPAIVLAALVAAALAVIFLLPRLRPAAPAAVATAPPPAAAPAPGAGPATPAAPAPDDAARAALRGEAQDLLERVRELDAALNGMGVAEWGAAKYRAATEALAAGERAYQSLDYAGARTSWSVALEGMQGLVAESERVFADVLARGQTALDAGDGAAAAAAFRIALAIRPDDAAATRGAARAAHIAEVVALVRKGEAQERSGDPAAAAASYEQARKLDPDYAPAAERLAAVRRALGERAYRAAMSAGFSALAAGQPAAARRHFADALRHNPGAPEAQDALRQAETLATSAAIAMHIDAAGAAAQAEDWAGAVAAWEAALKLDENLAAARDGITQATARRELDQRLARMIAQPERLSDDGVQEDARGLLARAGAVAAPGPKLKQQIAVLTALLAEARTPVPVTLLSDGATDVTIYRVGPQGRFTSRPLALRPGRYVAVGTRAGYRDVRVEFTLAAGGAPAEIRVQCAEPIPGSR
jgi:hypothetical protein